MATSMPRKKTKSPKHQKAKAVALTVTRFLLDQFLELGEIIPRPFETPYAYGRRLQGRPPFPQYRLKQEIKRMKNRGWIIEAKKQGKKFLKLTEKGRLQALYKQLQTIHQSSSHDWDGKWRLALFDIPEKGRHERHAIRKTLKSLNFYQLQKSVYIYPFEIHGDVIVYLRKSGLLPFIRFARIDRLDDDEQLKRHFKL